MKCRECHELLAFEVSEELSDEDARNLQEHLSTCASCRAERVGFGEDLAALRHLGQASIPEHVLQDVRRSVRETLERQRALRGRRRLAVAAVALLVLGGSWALTSQWGERDGVADSASNPAAVQVSDLTEPAREPAVVDRPSARSVVPADDGSGEPEETRGPSVAEAIQPPHPLAVSSKTDLAKSNPSGPSLEEPGSQTELPATAEGQVLSAEHSSIAIRWVTEDPDLVIYWLVEASHDLQEASNEASSV